jgi:hypothetical protein
MSRLSRGTGAHASTWWDIHLCHISHFPMAGWFRFWGNDSLIIDNYCTELKQMNPIHYIPYCSKISFRLLSLVEKYKILWKELIMYFPLK